MTQGDSLDTPPDDGHQETSPHIRASPDPSASIQERECGPVCVDEEHSITPPSKEESTTMPFSYIGHFLVAAPSPVNPADEPSRIVANTIGELRHYRMQAAIAGERHSNASLHLYMYLHVYAPSSHMYIHVYAPSSHMYIHVYAPSSHMLHTCVCKECEVLHIQVCTLQGVFTVQVLVCMFFF